MPFVSSEERTCILRFAARRPRTLNCIANEFHRTPKTVAKILKGNTNKRRVCARAVKRRQALAKLVEKREVDNAGFLRPIYSSSSALAAALVRRNHPVSPRMVRTDLHLLGLRCFVRNLVPRSQKVLDARVAFATVHLKQNDMQRMNV